MVKDIVKSKIILRNNCICMNSPYASKIDYLRTKRNCDCYIVQNNRRNLNCRPIQCTATELNVHPLHIGHSEKEVFHGTLLPGRFPKSVPESNLNRYQLLHRDTSRSGAIHIKKLQILRKNYKSSNINQSVSCSNVDFEDFPCKN